MNNFLAIIYFISRIKFCVFMNIYTHLKYFSLFLLKFQFFYLNHNLYLNSNKYYTLIIFQKKKRVVTIFYEYINKFIANI